MWTEWIAVQGSRRYLVPRRASADTTVGSCGRRGARITALHFIGAIELSTGKRGSNNGQY